MIFTPQILALAILTAWAGVFLFLTALTAKSLWSLNRMIWMNRHTDNARG